MRIRWALATVGKDRHFMISGKPISQYLRIKAVPAMLMKIMDNQRDSHFAILYLTFQPMSSGPRTT
jgi:hypothetical protein